MRDARVWAGMPEYCGPMSCFVDYSTVTCMCSVGQVGLCIYPVCSMVHKFVFSHICALCVCDQKMSAYTLIGQISLQKGCMPLVHSSPETFARSIEMYRECYIPHISIHTIVLPG